MLASSSFRLSPSPSTSSSTRSSHLSILSAPSSVSTPPPSPTGSKTYAFFGSPFSDDTPVPQPPPNPHKRTSSDGGKSDVSADDTPRADRKPFARSLNAEFFGPSLLPTPPPSIRSLSHSTSATGLRDDPIASPPVSRDTSTSPPSVRVPLPPLSRFFPSRARYGSESDRPLPSPPSSHALATNVRRDIVSLDTGAPPGYSDHRHAGEHSASPVDDHLDAAHPPSSQHTPTPTAYREHESASSSRIVPTQAQRPPTPPLSDPEQPSPTVRLEPGLTLTSSSLSLELVKTLGEGTFSSVWLARDIQGQLSALELVRKSSLARSKSLRGRRSRTIDGTRPTARVRKAKAAAGATTDGHGYALDSDMTPPKSPLLSPRDEQPMRVSAAGDRVKSGRLVAVKMTDRVMCDSSARNRVSFVREVEVLRHISHPSIVSYLHSFSTPSHHCLVLEHVGGGELLDLVDNPASHARIDEPLVRRIWGELCKAVAWMHSVGLVHRDIKLENILLTTDPFAQPPPAQSLIKLTDFGLSRFIDPAQPYLTTLCGSDSYAAPELVMGRAYDGRETDAWACGVVLYTLATRRLPFDAASPAPHVPAGNPHEYHYHQRHDHQEHYPAYVEADWEVQRRKRAERKALLNRIAQGAYAWPEGEGEGAQEEGQGPRRGTALAQSEGVRRVVGRLLVRDPRKRARVADLWDDVWMCGEGAPPAPPPFDELVWLAPSSAESTRTSFGEEDAVPIVVSDEDADVDADADDEGVLVDGEDIGPESVARQEH